MFCCRLYYFFICTELLGSALEAVGLCFFSLSPPEEVEVRARFFELLSEPSWAALAELCPAAECFRLTFEAFSFCFLFDCVICWYFIEMLWRAQESLGRLALLFLSSVLPLSCLSCPFGAALLSLSRYELATMFCFFGYDCSCWEGGNT